MILWTFRHTKPYNPKDVCYGQLDFDVSSSFYDEAHSAIEDFLKHNPKPIRLFSSPLKRCFKLAEEVSKKINLPIEKEDALQEINFGSWEGEKLSLVPQAEMNEWKKNLRSFRFPKGESFYDVDYRVKNFLNTLDENSEYLWITHAGVIASLLHFACNVPDDDFVEGKFSYTMVTRFELQKNKKDFEGSFLKIHDGIQMPPLPL